MQENTTYLILIYLNGAISYVWITEHLKSGLKIYRWLY